MNHKLVVERELKKIKTDAASIVPYIDKPEWNKIEIAGVSAIIASVYSGYESIFRNLCKYKVKNSERWHTELLENAIAEGLIPAGTEDILKDMLSFRHIQRNYYIHELKEPRVRQKAFEVLKIIIPAFDKHLQKFI